MSAVLPDTFRVDPYKNANFRVKWDGHYIPAIRRVTGLLRTTEVVETFEGGNQGICRKSAGHTRFEPLILERGLTDDTFFEDWANMVWNQETAQKAEPPLYEIRKTVYIEICDGSGQVLMCYKVNRCWPSEYQPLSMLDSKEDGELIERLRLEHEGWERDTSVFPLLLP